MHTGNAEAILSNGTLKISVENGAIHERRCLTGGELSGTMCVGSDYTAETWQFYNCNSAEDDYNANHCDTGTCVGDCNEKCSANNNYWRNFDEYQVTDFKSINSLSSGFENLPNGATHYRYFKGPCYWKGDYSATKYYRYTVGVVVK